MDSKWYQVGEVIGIGMRSVVHKAHCISNNSNSVVAIKIIDLEKSEEDMERVAHKHPQTPLRLHRLWVVMPFVSGASLNSIMAKRRSGMAGDYIAALLTAGHLSLSSLLAIR